MKVEAIPIFTQAVQKIRHASNEQELFNTLLRAIKILEFDYYTYCVRIHYPINKPTYNLYNNYPKNWNIQYIDDNDIYRDPIIKHGVSSTQSMTWNSNSIQHQPELWKGVSKYGFKSGWAQSAFLNSSSIGILTVTREDKDSTPIELLHKQPF